MWRCVVCLLVLAGIGGCKPSATQELRTVSENTLARVGSEVITVEDFQEAMRLRPVGDDPAAREALLKELIEFRVLVQEARARGYDRDPQIQRAYERLLANKVRADLEAARSTPSEITPQEIERYYREHETEFTVPTKIRLAMIFVEAPNSFTEEKRAQRRARIEEAWRKSQSDDFTRLAAEYSYDQVTKYKGGDLGYFVEGLGGADPDAMEPAAREAGFALSDVGEISQIIETEKGYYLLKLLERQPRIIRPLASVRNQIVSHLQRDRSSHRQDNLTAQILAGKKVEIERERLATVSAPRAERPALPDRATAPPAIPQR